MRHLPARLVPFGVVGVLLLGFLALPAAQSSPPIAWLIFVDDLHLEFRYTGQLRDLTRRLATLVRPTDLVGIHTTGPSDLMIDPTSDVTSVRDAIKRVTGNGLRSSEVIGNANDEVSYRANRALSAALKAVNTLEAVDASQKILIYVSNGYVNFDRVRTSPTRPDLAYEAMRAHVVIHAIDPRAHISGPERDPKVDDAAWEAQLVAWEAHLEETRESLRRIVDNTGLLLLDANPEDVVDKLALFTRR
jgi:hypothetical protein